MGSNQRFLFTELIVLDIICNLFMDTQNILTVIMDNRNSLPACRASCVHVSGATKK